MCTQILYRCPGMTSSVDFVRNHKMIHSDFQSLSEDTEEGGNSSIPHFLLGVVPNCNSKVPPLIKSS